MSGTPSPTARELEILKVIWERGACSVRDVHRQLSRGEDLAYNTVQTLMRIMEDKGLLAHKVKKRTFIYTSCFSRDESAARFLDRVFDGAASELVQSLLRKERISQEELAQMQAMISAARRKKGNRESERGPS
jgi:predicted transcriptional regulator